jgi:glucoamylase
MINQSFSAVLLSVVSSVVFASPWVSANQKVLTTQVPSLIKLQKPRATEYLLKNISPSDAVKGVVVASPSKRDPDYYYHWVRDAALVMESVHDLLDESTNMKERLNFEKMLFDFASFSRRNQLTKTLSKGLGEPKFYVDGRGYDLDWGRPQNDGPALRALVMIRFANHLKKDPLNTNYVKSFLYDSKLPTKSLIKADLEFIAHHWRDTSFDLWEEVAGDHFYTNMVQRAALYEGARFAEKMGDAGAAAFYRSESLALEERIKSYWNGRFLRATLEPKAGGDYKYSNLDLAIVLGVLHGATDDGFMSVTSPAVMNTVAELENAFKGLYAINRDGQVGLAIGRYPEDRYDGTSTNTSGNPWFLGGFAFAEYYYMLSKELKKLSSEGSKKSQNDYKEYALRALVKADEYMARGFYHMNQSTGSMAEQFNRYSGYMQGAHDLTWSYASFLTAAKARPVEKSKQLPQ